MATTGELTGRVVAGTYRVDEKLGEGGMGAVYRAFDVRLERPVALKVIRPELAATPDFVKRFEREAKVVARFAHPSWVQVYATGEDQGLIYMALEFVQGRELGKVLRERGRLDVPFVARIACDLLGGLEKAHELGIVHRDLKPANVMITGAPGQERVKILDLGIAKLREAVGTDQLTAPGMVLGTLAYMSPEQASGEDVDGRSDLYSVGIMLYELLTGSVPFTGRTPTELITQQLTKRPEPPRTKRADVPAELEAIVLRALEKRREDRFADARSFARALEPLTRGSGGVQPVAPPPVVPVVPLTAPTVPQPVSVVRPVTPPPAPRTPVSVVRAVAPPPGAPTIPFPPPTTPPRPAAGSTNALFWFFVIAGLLGFCFIAGLAAIGSMNQGY